MNQVYCIRNISSFEQDSVWSWFICFCCSICLMMSVGLNYALGVLFPVLMESFDESRERTGKLNNLPSTLSLGPLL